MAADLPVAPVYKAPPPMIAPLNWTGFYLGAGSGFAVFNADTSVQNPAGAPLFATSTQGGKGWLATGYVGYDYALSDHIVAGVLGDFDFGSVTGGVFGPCHRRHRHDEGKVLVGGRGPARLAGVP